MPEFTCPCGSTLAASTPNAKYCSDRCRKRVKRSGADAVGLVPPADDGPAGPVEGATHAELKAVSRLGTTLGQQALAAARRLDRSVMDTGSGYASLNRELRETLTAETRGVSSQTSPQRLREELAERRGHQPGPRHPPRTGGPYRLGQRGGGGDR